MPAWLTVVLCIFFLEVGFLIGHFIEGRDKKHNIVGSIIINKNDQNDVEGVYTVWDVEPKSIDQKNKYMMDIVVASLGDWRRVGIPQNSQESQGR